MAKAGIETLMSSDSIQGLAGSAADTPHESVSLTSVSPLHGLTIDDPVMCCVCFESGSKDGPHRLVSLKCGHLFGQSCIKQWMETKKKCPTCDKSIGKSDMRQLFIHCSGQRITSRIQSLIHSMNSEIGSYKSLVLKLQQENEDLVLQNQRLVTLSHGIDVRVTYDPVTLNVFSRTQDVFQVMVKQALFSLKYQVSLRTVSRVSLCPASRCVTQSSTT